MRCRTLLVPAVAIAVLAGCGSSGGGPAPDDAKAACSALVRSKDDLAKPGAATQQRLFGAASLGAAATAQDAKKFSSLGDAMKALRDDLQVVNVAKAAVDARAALSVCSDLKLPH